MKWEHRNDLIAFTVKRSLEISLLPTIKFKEKSFQFSVEASKCALEGREAFTKGSLEEAESKLLASLSYQENDIVRLDYALTLVEEKKYIEALPSCVEAALLDHYKFKLF